MLSHKKKKLKVEFLKEYAARTSSGGTRTIAAGAVLDLSPEKSIRLVDAGIARKIQSNLDISVREMFEERAAIMEYDGGMSREDAEKEAALSVGRYIAELYRLESKSDE